MVISIGESEGLTMILNSAQDGNNYKDRQDKAKSCQNSKSN